MLAENSEPQAREAFPITPHNFSKRIFIFIGGFVLLIIITLVLLLAKSGQKPQADVPVKTVHQNNIKSSQAKSEPGTNNFEPPKLTLSTIVYGSWNGQQSEIKSVDTISNKSTLLATLPLNVKKITIYSRQGLLYIDQTNDQDHGKQINMYQFKDKSIKTLVKASEGFGIDDYIVSPNRQYVALWEIQLSQTKTLKGGRSRVYTVKLSNPTEKRLIYDEAAVEPIHYPRAILNDGRIFTDRFLPNDPNGGAGWAYGMSVSDFEGSTKKDLEQMAEGTYGTQPNLSPDGKYLVFSGYDGSNGDGKAIKDGFRQALLNPNTVELLNLDTLERQKLPNLSNADTYTSANWDQNSGSIITNIISKSQAREGLSIYNLTQKSLTKLNIPDSDENPYTYITRLSAGNLLIGKIDTSSSSVGNLGDGYAASITQLFNLDTASNSAARIKVDNPYVQYITILPSNYFLTVLGAQTASVGNTPVPQPTIIDLYSDKNDTKQNLQLYTFLFKTKLSETREKQQSDPVPKITPFTLTKTVNCTELAIQQCGNSFNRNQCITKTRVDLKAQGKCNQSPLYLYGESGQTVTVKVQTTVYNDNPNYSGAYNIRLLPDGLMEINNQIYDSIDYDYKSNLRKLTPPSKGIISTQSDLEKTLRDYAKKLSLNNKETDDLVKFGEANIKSKYVFVSFFDQLKSEQILPLSFSPRPDNYRNIVFYFKQLNEAPIYTPVPPVFPAIFNRSGLTAVEVSEIVD